MNSKSAYSWVSAARRVVIFAFLLGSALHSFAADPAVKVQINLKKAGPREVESLTEQRILRDYRLAWTSMAQALEFNTTDPLEGPFAGDAKQQLLQTVNTQQCDGLSQRHIDQNRKAMSWSCTIPPSINCKFPMAERLSTMSMSSCTMSCS
jgi:hypothetical protein